MDVHHLALHSAALLRRRLRIVLDAFFFLRLNSLRSFSFFSAIARTSLFPPSLSFSVSVSLSLSRSTASPRRWIRKCRESQDSKCCDCELTRIVGYERKMRFTSSCEENTVRTVVFLKCQRFVSENAFVTKAPPRSCDSTNRATAFASSSV